MENVLEKGDDGLNPDQVKELAKSYNGEDEKLVEEGVKLSAFRTLGNKE